MKKSLMLVLWLCSIILLAWCKDQNVENPDVTDQWSDTTINSSWVKTSLTLEDLEHIEETMPPLSYSYQVFDRESQEMVYTWDYEVDADEEPIFSIPEYENMVSREIVSSGIEDDMIYTLTKFTAQDGHQFDVLYVNEPDTLFCRAINVEDGTKIVLYSSFIYDADMN